MNGLSICELILTSNCENRAGVVIVFRVLLCVPILSPDYYLLFYPYISNTIPIVCLLPVFFFVQG